MAMPQASSKTCPSRVSGPSSTAPRPLPATSAPVSAMRAKGVMAPQFQAMKQITPARKNSAPPSKNICRQ